MAIASASLGVVTKSPGAGRGGWMEGWMDGGVDGWRGGWVIGWVDGCVGNTRCAVHTSYHNAGSIHSPIHPSSHPSIYLPIYVRLSLHSAWRHEEEAVPHRGGQILAPRHAASAGLADVRQIRVPTDPPVRLTLPPQTKGARAADSLGAARLGLGSRRVSRVGRGGCLCLCLPLGSGRHGRASRVWSATSQSQTMPARGGRGGGELRRSRESSLPRIFLETSERLPRGFREASERLSRGFREASERLPRG